MSDNKSLDEYLGKITDDKHRTLILRLVEHAFRNGYNCGAHPVGNEILHRESEENHVAFYLAEGFKSEYGTN